MGFLLNGVKNWVLRLPKDLHSQVKYRNFDEYPVYVFDTGDQTTLVVFVDGESLVFNIDRDRSGNKFRCQAKRVKEVFK